MDNIPKNNKELKQKIASLHSYIAFKLGIKNTPRVSFIDSQENAEKKELGKTGYYDPSTKSIKLYITGRSDGDIMRSYSHECVHFFQDLNGTLKSNSNCGNHYAQEDPHLRSIEKQAFLLGSLLFRDFQDENRYGKPKIEPDLPLQLNENLKFDHMRLKDETSKWIRNLIESGIFISYHKELTSGDMNPSDFVEELTQKILKSIQEWNKVIDDKSNYESGFPFIK